MQAFSFAEGREKSFMKVGDVMSRGIDPIPPTASVQDAAVHMAEFDVGCVMIGTEEKLEGLLTDRDIILRVVVDGKSAADLTVADVMSSTIYTCRADDALHDVFEAMNERQIRRMPVLDDSGKAVGVITLSDIARVGRSSVEVNEALREIAEPHREAQLRRGVPG